MFVYGYNGLVVLSGVYDNLNNELVIYIFNPCSSEHHVYTIKLMLIILNLLIMVMTSIVSVNL